MNLKLLQIGNEIARKRQPRNEIAFCFSKRYACGVLRKADSLVRTYVSTCATLCAEVWVD